MSSKSEFISLTKLYYLVALTLGGLSLLFDSPPAFSQTQTGVQCIASAQASGTSDVITIPALPCALTTNLLILSVLSTNTTTTPTLQPLGLPAQTIIKANGNPVSAGDLIGGGRALLNPNGSNWILLNPASSFQNLGTGVGAALAINIGQAGAFVTFNGALGTPSSATLTNATGLPISGGVSGLGSGVAAALAIAPGNSGAPALYAGTGLFSSPLSVSASLPTISSCGTGTPAMTAGSSSNHGQVTLGTGSPTACTLTFLTPFATAAFCAFTPASNYTGTYYISAQSKTAVTLTLGTGTSNAVFNYACGGN